MVVPVNGQLSTLNAKSFLNKKIPAPLNLKTAPKRPMTSRFKNLRSFCTTSKVRQTCSRCSKQEMRTTLASLDLALVSKW